MMFIPDIKHTNLPSQPVMGIAVLFYTQMIFKPHRKHMFLHGLLGG
jgi:hypothetical protein